jgi:hypothetical protein
MSARVNELLERGRGNPKPPNSIQYVSSTMWVNAWDLCVKTIKVSVSTKKPKH